MTRDRALEILRYLIAGGINTAFGFGLYAALVWAGLDRYAAQAVGYVAGTAFNYVTYSRGVFRDAGPAKLRFALSYAANYLVNLAGLWAVSRLVANPYLAGAITTAGVVVVNYVVLKRLVFRA
ncbi:hypothetical protein GTZ99_16640 [Novosphingobium sp. FSY-8]|uniref:GtrA/DPMS transmembrane domain-containing protein n=1 Tax=Novosphingobium ovatum TaxID=1908523 RepID=A0ABW9XI06_9SPHN|nr:GtrA family protein [Novosphingobium ovatum]NBC38180.1 hypothetical protein [Novosphingobium ovatum]